MCLKRHTLLPRDLLAPHDEPPCAALTKEAPKGRRFARIRQIGFIEIVKVLECPSWLLESLAPEALLFDGSQHILGILLRRCSRVPKLRDTFSFAFVRTGGATAHFRRHRNAAALQFAGRWGRQHTLLHYQQEAIAMLMWRSMSE